MLFRLIQIFLITIFLLSAIGKALYLTETATALARLASLPPGIAQMLVYPLILFEIAVAGMILVRRFLHVLQWLPILFAAVLIYSLWRNLACGCFGNLPLLNELPAVGHGLLLAGMWAGLFSLRHFSETPTARQPKRYVSVTATVSLVLMLAAPMTIPFRAASFQDHLDTTETATIADVRRAIDTGEAVLVDARPAFEYEIGHIPGAINIPVDSENLQSLYEAYRLQGRALIVYCIGPYCDAAERLAARLKSLGHRRVRVFPGGWEAWLAEEDY